ncbi:MAG: AAA family ATPase [Alphaproteobacteria bacterium]|nr:AAA family ATPase [Alphaproteobacteria bacterium]
MYEAHFGLHEKPFSLLPDPRFLYAGRTHAMAMHMLEYGLAEQTGYVVLTGEVGTGKTTLLRHLLRSVDNHVLIGLVTNTHSSFGELMKWIMLAFDLDYTDKDAVTQHQIFTDFLIERYAHGQRVVLIVDEAQNLGREALEQLRMLSNINAESDHLLQLILVGQPELRQLLGNNSLRQFVQRISIDYHLKPLDREDTASYVRHRLETAGGDPDVFDSVALATVHYFARGLPRLVNSLCDLSLVYAFAEDRTDVDFDTVFNVIETRVQDGLSTFRPLPESETRANLRRRIVDEPETLVSENA